MKFKPIYKCPKPFESDYIKVKCETGINFSLSPFPILWLSFSPLTEDNPQYMLGELEQLYECSSVNDVLVTAVVAKRP